MAKLLLYIALIFTTLSASANELDINFNSFLDNYTESIEFQKKHTKIPLEMLTIDPLAEPEPKAVESILSQNKIVFPLILNKKERLRNSLEIQLEDITNNTARVLLFKEDTGWRVLYIFKKIGGIWQLVRVEDYSI